MHYCGSGMLVSMTTARLKVLWSPDFFSFSSNMRQSWTFLLLTNWFFSHFCCSSSNVGPLICIQFLMLYICKNERTKSQMSQHFIWLNKKSFKINFHYLFLMLGLLSWKLHMCVSMINVCWKWSRAFGKKTNFDILSCNSSIK